jgi:beta-lactamase regulating signal transducer with metallopeptidase domain
MTAMLLNHLWQSTLFALAVGGLTLLFRNNGAAVRHGLWLAASVKFLLPFSLLAGLGGMAFTHTVTPASMRTLARIEPAAMPFNAPPALPAAHHLSWILVAAAAWAFGFAAITQYWLARAARLRRIVRESTPLAIDAPVPVRATPELLEPGLAGILRPVILVPESLAQKLSQGEIDTILAHELCHLRRGDNLAAMIHMLVEALFWFHPLVWFIGARLVEEREQACDEGVLEDGKPPQDYARAILKVCRLYFRSPLPCVSGVSGADLDRRITAIMTRRDIVDIDPNKILLLAGLGAFVVMTPLVVGGLKQASPAPLVHELARMFVPAESRIAPVTPAHPRHAVHRVAKIPAPPEKRLVAAPRIDASQPFVILPTPELAAEPVENTAPERLVCRPPQRMSDSRLMGPQVCLPQRVWDKFKAQGQVLLPDGRTMAISYDEQPLTCMSVGTNASAATNWYVACRQ